MRGKWWDHPHIAPHIGMDFGCTQIIKKRSPSNIKSLMRFKGFPLLLLRVDKGAPHFFTALQKPEIEFSSFFFSLSRARVLVRRGRLC